MPQKPYLSGSSKATWWNHLQGRLRSMSAIMAMWQKMEISNTHFLEAKMTTTIKPKRTTKKRSAPDSTIPHETRYGPLLLSLKNDNWIVNMSEVERGPGYDEIYRGLFMLGGKFNDDLTGKYFVVPPYRDMPMQLDHLMRTGSFLGNGDHFQLPYQIAYQMVEQAAPYIQDAKHSVYLPYCKEYSVVRHLDREHCAAERTILASEQGWFESLVGLIGDSDALIMTEPETYSPGRMMQFDAALFCVPVDNYGKYKQGSFAARIWLALERLRYGGILVAFTPSLINYSNETAVQNLKRKIDRYGQEIKYEKKLTQGHRFYDGGKLIVLTKWW